MHINRFFENTLEELRDKYAFLRSCARTTGARMELEYVCADWLVLQIGDRFASDGMNHDVDINDNCTTNCMYNCTSIQLQNQCCWKYLPLLPKPANLQVNSTLRGNLYDLASPNQLTIPA